MVRVAGTDPGTSSLDILILDGETPAGQIRFSREDIQKDPLQVVRWLNDRGPYDLIAGPSGYGLPLKRSAECLPSDLALMTLTRPDEKGASAGITGFSALLREFVHSNLPVIFLPGVIHLPSVPVVNKINRIDLGTADKLCVAAAALHWYSGKFCKPLAEATFCLVELGTAFSACLVISGGKIVDGSCGSAGPMGWRSCGAWDGEVAYLLSPLNKSDLFSGGANDWPDTEQQGEIFLNSLIKAMGGLQAAHRFDQVVLSGKLLENEEAFAEKVKNALTPFGDLHSLESLQHVWVKQAAQGAAILANGLAGGNHSPLVDHLSLRKAEGTIFDWINHPRISEIKDSLLKF